MAIYACLHVTLKAAQKGPERVGAVRKWSKSVDSF